ncbi:MAG: tetratricopeptide repeat protein, partial [Deltaproteobacteria bacterium]|nr:tetratricopeptide repeat protein [Deltaproteobacteria bacterium]
SRLRQLLENQDATIARAHNDSGVIAWQEGHGNQALEHYLRAVELAPGNSVYRKNLADLLYFGRGETENALAHYRQILVDNPQDFDAAVAIGRICSDLSRHFGQEAADFLDLAGQIEPGNDFVREERKKLATVMNVRAIPASQPQQTQPSPPSLNFTSAADKKKSDPSAAYQQLVSAFNPENPAATETEIKKFLGNFPDFALAHNDLGVISHQLDKLEQAEKAYETAVRLAPNNITFRKNLADFLFVIKKQPEAAMVHYHEVLKSAPKDIETLMMIGNLCLALGSQEEARNFFNLVLDIEPWNLDASKALEMLESPGNER